MTTQLQQCREVAAALDEEVTEWRRKDAEWRERRNAAEKALHDMPFVMDNYRAALARAEAAEAEAAEARATNEALAELAASETERRVALAERVAELEAALASADDETASASAQAVRFWRTNNKLAARVAELEAQVAAQSAQGWRDFTERPPIGEQIQITTVIDAVREEPDGLYRIGNTSEWQAWRPAPQEPTP